MNSILKVALTLVIFASSVSAYAQTPTNSKSAPKAGTTITKKSQLHDGCHSRRAQMSGKPCH